LNRTGELPGGAAVIAEEDVRTLETEAMISDKLKFEEERVRGMIPLCTCAQHTVF
jgi:hypothetical protein